MLLCPEVEVVKRNLCYNESRVAAGDRDESGDAAVELRPNINPGHCSLHAALYSNYTKANIHKQNINPTQCSLHVHVFYIRVL